MHLFFDKSLKFEIKYAGYNGFRDIAGFTFKVIVDWTTKSFYNISKLAEWNSKQDFQFENYCWETKL